MGLWFHFLSGGKAKAKVWYKDFCLTAPLFDLRVTKPNQKPTVEKEQSHHYSHQTCWCEHFITMPLSSSTAQVWRCWCLSQVQSPWALMGMAYVGRRVNISIFTYLRTGTSMFVGDLYQLHHWSIVIKNMSFAPIKGYLISPKRKEM